MKKKVIVIGGGLAGSLLCNQLVKHADVTLLEVGSKDSIQYPQIGFDNKKLAHVDTFCFGGGGTTNLWHNGLIPIIRGDVVDQEFSQVLAEAQPFMDEAASALFFRKEPFPCLRKTGIGNDRHCGKNRHFHQWRRLPGLSEEIQKINRGSGSQRLL